MELLLVKLCHKIYAWFVKRHESLHFSYDMCRNHKSFASMIKPALYYHLLSYLNGTYPIKCMISWIRKRAS